MTDYNMYSEDGNLEVGLIVEAGKQFSWDWTRIQIELFRLAETPEYDEATDTAVRESVYKALGFQTPFYD